MRGGRVGGVDRQTRRRPHHGEERDGQVDGAAGGDGDQVAAADPGGDEGVGEPAGAPVELGVAQLPRRRRRRRCGRCPRLRTQQVQHGPVVRRRDRGAATTRPGARRRWRPGPTASASYWPSRRAAVAASTAPVVGDVTVNGSAGRTMSVTG